MDYFLNHGTEAAEIMTCSSHLGPFRCQVADDYLVINEIFEKNSHNQGLFSSKWGIDEEFPNGSDPHVVSVVNFVCFHPCYEFWDRNIEFELIDYC